MSNIQHLFEEPGALTGVAAFHDMFQMPVISTPSIPDDKRCQLRVSLLQEELDELKTAIVENDIVAVADALSDLQMRRQEPFMNLDWEVGLKDCLMKYKDPSASKTCKTMEDAIATQDYYLREKATESFIEEREGEFLVYRSVDRKVLKSIKYSEANLEAIVFSKD